ncbi:hypothetical protein F0562_028550 [Nyssa sinensis]|uniref:Uncharacterized protein n=1 Tax=Nyssa sinensis TaxID=561372 RepID=A0A5J5B2L2_9ASTE|nr:hypothetical protein F0562_028550 [Nyssa sinensis]
MCVDVEKSPSKDDSKVNQDVIILEDDHVANEVPDIRSPVVVLDSDDEEPGHPRHFYPYQKVVLRSSAGEFLVKDCLDGDFAQTRASRQEEDRGVYVGVEDDMEIEIGNHQTDNATDGLADIWKEMTIALECSKNIGEYPSSDVHVRDVGEECDHSFVLKDDLGYVCRIFRVIQKGIETIIEFQDIKFLKLDTSGAIRRRIESRMSISGARNHLRTSKDVFYELVEHTLQKDDNFRRKVAVIQDLREMTSKILHYYKGDFLDELPGLVDFTVFLNLSPRQMSEVAELKKMGRKFKKFRWKCNLCAPTIEIPLKECCN